MTLILTTLDRYGVIQIVDRLVTVRSPQGSEPWDIRSNKTILFAPRDALCTISYTGLAYIDDLPTDQWIAEMLCGAPMSLGPDGRPATFSLGRVAKLPSAGLAIQRLVSNLETTMARLMPVALRSEPLTIVVTGWQLYRRKRPRVFGIIIKKLPGHYQPTILRLPRYITRERFLITEPEGHLSSEEQRAFLKRLIGLRTADEVEHAMIAQLRRVAARTNAVGPHCMCVILPPCQIGWARVRYDSPEADVGYLINKSESRPFPAAFTPWVLTEHLSMAPSITSGGGAETQIGHWLLKIIGTAQRHEPKSTLSLQSSQERRPGPTVKK